MTDLINNSVQFYRANLTVMDRVLSRKGAAVCKQFDNPIVKGVMGWCVRHEMETFFSSLALCAGNSPITGEFPHKGQWRGALKFSMACARINGWVNNREAGDLRRHRAHYDVNVTGWGSLE